MGDVTYLSVSSLLRSDPSTLCNSSLSSRNLDNYDDVSNMQTATHVQLDLDLSTDLFEDRFLLFSVQMDSWTPAWHGRDTLSSEQFLSVSCFVTGCSACFHNYQRMKENWKLPERR